MKNNNNNQTRSAESDSPAKKGEAGGRGVLEAYIRNQGALRRFIARHLVSAADIDDISQEAFLRAFHAEKSKPIEQPKSFLFRIARNLMLSEFSRKSNKVTDHIEDFEFSEVVAGVGDNLEDSVMARQKLGIFCEAVAALPPVCRRVVLLRKVYGMSHKEIANIMGIAVSTVEKHLAKGLRQCDQVLAVRYAEPESSSSEPLAEARGSVEV